MAWPLRQLALCGLLALWGCPAPEVDPDGGGEEPDAATEDAGLPDSGEVVDAGPSDAGLGAVPIASWCYTQALARCARDLRCGRLEQSRLEACIARLLESCDQPAYSGAVAAGRLQYFPQQGGQCLDGYAATACPGTPTPPACEGLFQGLVPPDGGCLLVEECASGSFCQLYLNTCPYRCFAYSPVGEGCNWYDRQCDPQLGSCELVDAGTYGCVARAGVGQACTSSSLCRAELACSQGRCIQRNAALGEACNESDGYPYCGPEAFCRTGLATDGGSGGLCQKRVGLGGVCTGYGACLPNLRCSSSFQTGTCIGLGDEGSTCTGYGECKNELFCWSERSTCTAYPPDGGDCTGRGSDYSCGPGFFCDFDRPNAAYECTRKKTLGEKCSYDGVCQSNACEYGPLSDGGNAYRCTLPCSVRAADGGF